MLIVSNKNIRHNGLYLLGRKMFLSLMQYPRKKKGMNDNVLCIDIIVFKGEKPAKILIQNVKIIIDFLLFNILLGIICNINLQ